MLINLIQGLINGQDSFKSGFDTVFDNNPDCAYIAFHT